MDFLGKFVFLNGFKRVSFLFLFQKKSHLKHVLKPARILNFFSHKSVFYLCQLRPSQNPLSH